MTRARKLTWVGWHRTIDGTPVLHWRRLDGRVEQRETDDVGLAAVRRRQAMLGLPEPSEWRDIPA